MSQTLVCNHCHQTNKLFRYSYNKKYNKYYPHNQCRECSSALSAKWINENKDRAREIARAVGKKRYQTEERQLWLKARDRRRKPPLWDAELTELVLKEAHSLTKLREYFTGVNWHVDHIIPIKGKHVSGLHVWNNIQVIPASLNLSKGNRWTYGEDQGHQAGEVVEDTEFAEQVHDSDEQGGLGSVDEDEPDNRA